MPEKANMDHASVNLVVTFEETPKIDALAKIAESLFYYNRMSSVPKGEERSLKWTFESVGVIDPKKMIREIQIKCDTREEWAEISQQQTKVSLRREDLPWWEFVILDNTGKEDSLILFRFDHGIGDGLAFAKVFTKMIKTLDGQDIESMIPKKMMDKKTSVNWFKMILGFPKALFDVLTAPNGKPDDPTVFSKNIVGPEVYDNRHRKLLVFDKIPLDFIKALKNAAGITLNDVLLTTWSRTVHEYCTMQECPVLKKKGENLLYRTLLPFGLPNKSEDPELALRNTWVSVSLQLPVGMKNISQIVKYVSKKTSNLKSSPLALVQVGVQNRVLSVLPQSVSRQAVYDIHSKRSTTFSNVPGPAETIMLAEQPVKSIMFFTNHLHPVVSCFTYNGSIHITLVLDDGAIANADVLPMCFMKSLVLFAKEFNVEVPDSIMQASR